MQKLKNSVRLCLIYAAVVLLAGGQPMVAMAETVDTPPLATQETSTTTTLPPEEERTYTYNPDTNRWDSDKWAYNPKTGQYEAVVVPLVETQQPVVLPPAADTPTTSATITSDTDAVINNNLHSNATTGDATIHKNTTGGSATTGDATAIANLMNTVNSSVSGGGAEFATFVTDVVGDVHGDIMLYPMLLAAMLQAADKPSNSTVTVNNDAAITNDLNLNAKTGNAAVTNNTTAGNATTGTANTVANVMNIINSIIAANQSFVGTVNIYGNLDGDILVAPDFLPQLLASNTGSGSSAPANSLLVSADDTQSIINNIDLKAATGNALVSNNTNAGSATTGDAKTNLVLLNLSGHQIVAKDSLLVFVNVLGQWVGLIVDAPEGASAAALGTGVTLNNVAPDLTIKVDNNSRIVNNLKLNSQSGDATVANNTNAGSAATGDATASANVANISGSQLGLTGWFGVLFINVFGNWFGSFGVDTARGNPATPGQGGMDNPKPAAKPASQPFQFIPHDEPSKSVAAPSFASFITGQPLAAAEEAIVESVTEESEEPALTAYVPGAGAASGEAPVAQNAIASESRVDFLPLIGSVVVLGLGAVLTKLAIAIIRGRGLTA